MFVDSFIIIITYYTPRFILFSIGFDIDEPSKNSKEENMSVAMVT